MSTTKAQRDATLNEVKMYQSNGWDLAEETPEFFLLKRNTGTVGVHLVILFFFWWTLGLANLGYWALCKQTKKIIK